MSNTTQKKEVHYKEKFEEHINNTLNANIHDRKCRSKTMSVLSYIIKYCKLNDGVFSMSYADFHKKYQDWDGHPRMCLANFKKIIVKLSDLKLIFINKFNNKNVYCYDQKIADKVAKKILESNPNYKGMKKVSKNGQSIKPWEVYNTDTNMEQLLAYYKKSYKGISGNRYATKKELVEIAKTLMAIRNIHQLDVQSLVFKKIYTLQKKINIKGAISYMTTIVNEKYKEAAFIRSKMKPYMTVGDEIYYKNLEKAIEAIEAM